MICGLVFTSGAGMSCLRADDDADLAGVAPRHALQFLQRQLLRVDADAALGAAVGQVDGGVLDAHPGRQRHHLFQRHVGVVAHAALAGAAAQVVLHAVALEVRDIAVVQFDGDVDDQRALGALERLGPARQVAQVGHDAVDLHQVGAPGAVGGGVDEGQGSSSSTGLLCGCCGRGAADGAGAARLVGGSRGRQQGRTVEAAPPLVSPAPCRFAWLAGASVMGLPAGSPRLGRLATLPRMNPPASPSSAAATWPAP
jgi:hypothetical protein